MCFYKLIVEVSDKFISAKQVLIRLPLVENVISFRRIANGIQHIAVALAVDAFLEGLDRKAEVDLICRNILRNIRQIRRLQGIQIYEEA